MNSYILDNQDILIQVVNKEVTVIKKDTKENAKVEFTHSETVWKYINVLGYSQDQFSEVPF